MWLGTEMVRGGGGGGGGKIKLRRRACGWLGCSVISTDDDGMVKSQSYDVWKWWWGRGGGKVTIRRSVVVVVGVKSQSDVVVGIRG